MKAFVQTSILVVLCLFWLSGPTPVAAQASAGASKEPLRVLAYSSPGFFQQGESGPTGIEYDLLRYYADSTERVLEIIWVEQFQDLIPRLIAGDGDLISATMTITPKRQRVIDFTASYFPVQIRLVTREDRPITDLAQLDGETVGAVKGTTGEQALIAIPGTQGHHERDAQRAYGGGSQWRNSSRRHGYLDCLRLLPRDARTRFWAGAIREAKLWFRHRSRERETPRFTKQAHSRPEAIADLLPVARRESRSSGGQNRSSRKRLVLLPPIVGVRRGLGP